MNRSLDPELLERYLAGEGSGDDLRRLSEELRTSPELREEFIELVNLDSALADASEPVPETISDSAIRAALEAVDRAPPPSSNRGRSRLRWAAAVAIIIVLLTGTSWWQASRSPLATVHSQIGDGDLVPGRELRGETHRLESGAVELRSRRGARIVIEAPAEFRFESAERLHLSRGRLSAEVPPAAKGFTVVTPSGEAVDLGTRFGVDVPRSGPAEIHVFEGEVITRASGARVSESLREGDAVQLDRGASASRELRSAAFIQGEEMTELAGGLPSDRRARARTATETLRRDPALITLLDFETGDLPPGTFRLVQGRWPGSRAPEFVDVGDHMSLDVGGDRECPHLTLAAWVRLDHLGAPYQSLLHTDGWSQSDGQVHWMVTGSTTMRLALFGNTLAPGSDEQEHYPDSRTPVLPERGRWVHLVTVYDADAKTVRFYLNGKFDKESRQEVAHPARLGPARIGNWDRHDRKLSGRLDELVLLGRALDDDEVRALYKAGNPYR